MPIFVIGDKMTVFDPRSLPTTSFGAVVNVNKTGGVPDETAALLENFCLEDEVVKAIYESEALDFWFINNGIEKLDFGGGEKGITAGMIGQVPKTLISNIKLPENKKVGQRRAREIVDTAIALMSNEPGY